MSEESETINANDVEAPTPRDIELRVFITFDEAKLKEDQLSLKGFTMTEQNDRLRSFISNPGLPLNRDDMALILNCDERFTGILGDDWNKAIKEAVVWGVVVSFNNHHTRIYGYYAPPDLRSEVSIHMQNIDFVYNDILRYAEQSLVKVQTLLTLSSIDARLRDGATVTGKGTKNKKAPTRKR